MELIFSKHHEDSNAVSSTLYLTKATELMKRISLVLIGLLLLSSLAISQRKVHHLPKLGGFITLKCDFHMHTVFSDGNVWPNNRVDEAWNEGLDAISITDHIEYQPHKKYIPVDHNAAFNIVENYAKQKNIILVHGTEVTRSMPPGHLNALFVEDATKLDKPDFMEVMEEARKQGAFVHWNHPGWKGQQKDGIAKWYEVHGELVEKDWMQGIEFFNNKEYYPNVLDWCLEKDLAVIANSDVHGITDQAYDLPAGNHRPMTLVFAKERTQDALKEAMFARRTVAYFGNSLAGKEDLLRPLFKAAIIVHEPFMETDKQIYLELENKTDLDFSLEATEEGIPATIQIPAHSIASVRVNKEALTKLNYKVNNMMIGSDKFLEVKLK